MKSVEDLDKEILLYKTASGEDLPVKTDGETVWMNQLQMAELFGVKLNTINYHIKEILKSGELSAEATIRKIRIVQKEGCREVSRPVDFNNLDMIISVGYRVNSKRGIQSEHRDRRGNPRPTLALTDIAKFNAQYPTLGVQYNETFHDRFLILDDKELYLIGSSLKDLGKKCFAFTRLDAGEIAGLKARVK